MAVTPEMRRGAIRIFELAYNGRLMFGKLTFESGFGNGRERCLGCTYYFGFHYPFLYYHMVDYNTAAQLVRQRLGTLLSSLSVPHDIRAANYFKIPDTLENRTKLESFGQLSEEEFRAIEHFLGLGAA